MPIRKDKFAVGDKVTWFDDYYATLTNGREKHGGGPFEVIAVESPPNRRPYDDDGQSLWQSMGHTQHITIKSAHVEQTFSGAFFRKVHGA